MYQGNIHSLNSVLMIEQCERKNGQWKVKQRLICVIIAELCHCNLKQKLVLFSSKLDAV